MDKKIQIEQGFIYARTHLSYKSNFKIGKTIDLRDRDKQFRTSEYFLGHFISVYLVNKKDLDIIDRLIKKELKTFSCIEAVGTEFYRKEVIDQNMIEKLLIDGNFLFRRLNSTEIQAILEK